MNTVYESARKSVVYETQSNLGPWTTGGNTASGTNTSNTNVATWLQGLGIFESVLGIFGNLSCWGVTWPPQEGQDFVENALPALNAQLLGVANASDIETAVNNVIYDFRRSYSSDEAWLKRCDNPAKGCSAETLQAMTDSLYNGLKGVLNNFVATHPQLNLEVVPAQYKHIGADGTTKCGETFASFEVRKRSIISLPSLGGVQNLAGGGSWLWVIAIIGLYLGTSKKGKRQIKKLRKNFK